MSDWIPENTTHDWHANSHANEHVSLIRTNPEEYIGGLNAGGIVHMLLEVLAYVHDEAVAGGATRATVGRSNAFYVVTDNGRGTQAVKDPATGDLLAKPIMASADLRFFQDDTAPILASGYRRRGISVVNALSAELIHSSLRRNSFAWSQRYAYGMPIGPPDLLDTHPQGTQVRFRPDDMLFNVPSDDVLRLLKDTLPDMSPLELKFV